MQYSRFLLLLSEFPEEVVGVVNLSHNVRENTLREVSTSSVYASQVSRVQEVLLKAYV
jgi:hypothetical protein